MKLVEQENGKTFLHPAVILLILAVGLAVGLLIPQGGISWTLWGFAEQRFTVGEEQISLRLDTSGVGPYEVECRDNRIQILRSGTVLLEGEFFFLLFCVVYQRDAWEAEDCRILEDGTEEAPLLVCGYPKEDGTGYALIVQIEGSAYGAVFRTPEDSVFSQQDALDYMHRLQFQKLD